MAKKPCFNTNRVCKKCSKKGPKKSEKFQTKMGLLASSSSFVASVASSSSSSDRRRVTRKESRAVFFKRENGRRRRGSVLNVSTSSSASKSPPWTNAKPCRLVLEDGTVWSGKHFGAEGTRVGEVVFNTSLSGCVIFVAFRACNGEDESGEGRPFLNVDDGWI